MMAKEFLFPEMKPCVSRILKHTLKGRTQGHYTMYIEVKSILFCNKQTQTFLQCQMKVSGNKQKYLHKI